MTPKRHVSVLAILLLAGLAAAPAQRGSQEERIAALEASVASLQRTQETTLGRLDQLRLDLDNTLEPLRVRLADAGEEMRSMEARLGALEEELTLANEGLARLSAQLSTGSGGAPPVTGPAMPPPTPPAGMTGPTAVRPADRPAAVEPAASEADAMYSSAYTDYLGGNYALAISGFREYLRRFPGSEMADNAQYWIGECLFAQERFAQARDEFLAVRRAHTDGDAVPAARFKAALALLELGQELLAVDEMVALIEDHPTAEPTRLACERLGRLGHERPPACIRY